jgi:kynurenine formamidase
MCVKGTTEAVRSHHHEGSALSRRSFLKFGGAVTAGAALAAAGPALPALATHRGGRVADLTHRLVEAFPSFLGPQAAFSEVTFDFATAGFYSKTWTVSEHIGTHIDTPGHFTEGLTLVDRLDPRTLIAPIVVVDIKDKAAADANAMVEPADLMAFEATHGRIPRRAIVAMNSGWASKVEDAEAFRGGDGFPDLNFPGFSIEATDWLVANRSPVGIGVDTMSLDPGNSATFDVHVGFLGTGRYGIENLANLDAIPPRGAQAFVGPIPWEDGSGSPCRVLAVS